MDKFGLPQKITEELLNYFQSKPEIEKVIIFGSRAKGNFRSGSDIDFAILGDNITASHIAWDLEDLPTPYKFDVVDYNSLTHEGMKSSIDCDGKMFYQKSVQ